MIRKYFSSYLFQITAILFLLISFADVRPAFAGTPIVFPVNLSENVTVTGTPRLAMDIGGVTRYATYASGSGTSVLNFSYTVQAGDFDADGISVSSPLDLNGGSITDIGGNATTLTFIPPVTSGIKVQAYSAAFTTIPVDDTNKTAAGFNIAGAPNGSTYNYTITSSGGGGSITGSGTISADPQVFTGINVSALLSGTLTVSATITAASGTGNAKTGTVAYTNSFTGVLDGLPATASAFSTRRLATAYTGSLLRVRRASDNAEQDIGYTGTGDLDTTSLTTFCGVSSCFVKTLYDQSGNTRNATQTTTAKQPRIVNAGAVDVINTRPSIVFDGSGDYLEQSSGVLGAMANITILSTFKMNVAQNMQMFDIRDAGNGNPVLDEGNADGFAARRRNDSATLVNTTVMSKNTTPHVTAITYDGAILSHRIDGGAANIVASSGATTGSFFITLANNGFITVATGFNGAIPEFIFFPSLLSTPNRQAVEANEKAYFGTP
ncbi:MAG: arabinofuranosidase catalytic domain-containing protein [Pseudomonadota bacterium]